MAEDRKFKFEDGGFVNRVSGEAIPDDEPVILFRARDKHSIAVLMAYLDMVSHPHHRQAVMDRLDEFSAYRAAHPERLKEPGITGHIRLNSDASPAPAALGEMDLLKRLGENKNFELSFDYHRADEGDDGWCVHRVNGGVNDREWTLIGSGATPEAALAAALVPAGRSS
jgi:hypothetical protein